MVFAAAKQKFPNHKIFLDNQEHFALSKLVANVKKSKNILVFLSPNYGSSPYSLVELCTAVQCGAKISTVLVHRPGLGLFNFEQMNALLKSGDVTSLLDENGWSVVHEHWHGDFGDEGSDQRQGVSLSRGCLGTIKECADGRHLGRNCAVRKLK